MGSQATPKTVGVDVLEEVLDQCSFPEGARALPPRSGAVARPKKRQR
jgi:hypothetical protein